MGRFHSKSPPPKPDPILRTPWRIINWTDTKEPLRYINNYKPPVEGQLIRILLYGPAGAGKSSFVNSLQSVLLGRMYNLSLVDSTMGKSFTRKFAGFHLLKDEVSHSPFVFYDMMGLEEKEGILVEDVRLVLDGHVKDNYIFHPENRLSEDSPFYNSNPTFSDKVHVLVCVVPADNAEESIVKQNTLLKIKNIRKEASRRGIPQMVLLTRIDKYREISSDLENVYRLRSLQTKMKQFEADVGIPLNCIFPVKNYHGEIDLNTEVDSLVLSAAKHIITAGGDYCRRHVEQRST